MLHRVATAACRRAASVGRMATATSTSSRVGGVGAMVKRSGTYFAVPEPSWNVEHVNALATGKRGRSRRTVKLGHRLNPYESKAMNLAKRHGYLVTSTRCGQSVCNKYLHYCFEDRRPYIAINPHGDRVVVDLTPVEGLGGFRDTTRREDAEDLFSEVLLEHWLRHFHIVNKIPADKLTEQVQAAAAEDIDGSNDHKANDSDITAQFQLLTAKRQESMVLARDLVKAFVEADEGRQSAREKAEAREAKRLQRLYKSQKMMRRKLRELIADKKTFARLPKGALDGFIKYDAENRPHLKWYPATWINKPC